MELKEGTLTICRKDGKLKKAFREALSELEDMTDEPATIVLSSMSYVQDQYGELIFKFDFSYSYVIEA